MPLNCTELHDRDMTPFRLPDKVSRDDTHKEKKPLPRSKENEFRWKQNFVVYCLPRSSHLYRSDLTLCWEFRKVLGEVGCNHPHKAVMCKAR